LKSSSSSLTESFWPIRWARSSA